MNANPWGIVPDSGVQIMINPESVSEMLKGRGHDGQAYLDTTMINGNHYWLIYDKVFEMECMGRK